MTIPFAINPGALTCGANPGLAGDPGVHLARSGSPAPCTSVIVDVCGDLITDSESEMRMAMARQ